MVKHTGGIFSPLEPSPFVQGVINNKTVIAFLRCKRTNVTIDDTLRKKRSKAQPVYTGVRKKTIICVLILSILVDTLNSYKEDSYAAIGRAA